MQTSQRLVWQPWGIGAALLLGVIAFVVAIFAARGGGATVVTANTTAPTTTGQRTLVCGPYAAPSVLYGVITEVDYLATGTRIAYADGWTFHLSDQPGVKRGVLGLLALDNGTTKGFSTGFAPSKAGQPETPFTANDATFNPCKAGS